MTTNLEQIALSDYEVKSELQKGLAEYYQVKSGLESLDRFVQYHPDPSRLMQIGVTFSHKGLESIAEAMADKKPWAAIMPGLNPSGLLHFGHKQVLDELLWLQKQGADIFIPISNEQTYLVGEANSLAESRRTAYENIIPGIIAMGFKPEKTHIFVDSDYPDIYNVAIDLSKHLSLNRVFGVFGFGKDQEGENPGTLFYRGAVQLAHILLPQYSEFGGVKPTLIPVGIDQYPYIQLARDLAKNKSMNPPAAIFLKFALGLDGKGQKMSASRPKSAIYLTDDPQTVLKKLKAAYTGGSVLADFQREHGGIPDICPIHNLMMYHFAKDDGLGRRCSTGEILCSECKKEAGEQILNYLAKHQSELAEANKRVNEFILNTPIRSIFNKCERGRR